MAVIDPGPAERPYTSNDVDTARIVLGLPRNRFADVGGGIGPVRIVARCVHCAALFVANSHDLADLDHINKGNCGCQSKRVYTLDRYYRSRMAEGAQVHASSEAEAIAKARSLFPDRPHDSFKVVSVSEHECPYPEAPCICGAAHGM